MQDKSAKVPHGGDLFFDAERLFLNPNYRIIYGSGGARSPFFRVSELQNHATRTPTKLVGSKFFMIPSSEYSKFHGR
jgi:hypothetical protein